MAIDLEDNKQLEAFVLGLSLKGLPINAGSSFKRLTINTQFGGGVALAYNKILPFGRLEVNMDILKCYTDITYPNNSNIRVVNNIGLGTSLKIERVE